MFGLFPKAETKPQRKESPMRCEENIRSRVVKAIRRAEAVYENMNINVYFTD